MTRKPFIFATCSVTILLLGSAHAGRPDKDWKSWFGHVAGGYSAPTDTASMFLEGGFNLNGGATYWPEEWPVGIDLELGYNDWSVKREVLDDLADAAMFDNTLNGDVTVWTLTADAMWGPPPGGGVNVYLAGGVGVYYEVAEITTPTTTTGFICDPWWWWCVPGVISGNSVIGDESSTNFGYNVGAGVTFEVGLGSQVYIEAKYHRYERDNESTDYIPIVIGYRW